MALDLGELSARLTADNSGFRRGLQESRRDIDQFSRDVNGRLRDARGRFATEGAAAGRGVGDGLERGARPGASRFGRLLGNLGDQLGDLAKKGVGGVQDLGGAFAKLAKENPQLAIGGAVALLGVLPIASGVAAAAITVGLGGAIAGLGIKAAAGTSQVKRAFADLSEDVKEELQELAKPFERTLLSMVATARKDLGGLSDDLGRAFATLAPRVEGAFANVSKAIGGLGPQLAYISQQAGPLIDMLGHELGVLVRSLGGDFQQLAAAADPRFITVLIGSIKGLSGVLTETIVIGSKFGSWILDLTEKIPGVNFDKPAQSLGQVAAELGDLGKSAPIAVQAAKQVEKGLKDAGDSALDLTERTAGAQAALDAFFNPSLRVFNATTQLKTAFQQLAEALAKSEGQLEGNADATLASRNAFGQALTALTELRAATAAKTGDDIKARTEAQKYLPVLYALAGQNKEAKAQVDALAKSLGATPGAVLPAREEFQKLARQLGLDTAEANALFKALDRRAVLKADISDIKKKLADAEASLGRLPKDKQTKVRADIAELQAKLKAAQTALDQLQGKTVTVTTVMRSIRASENIKTGYAEGGLVTGPGTGTSDSIPTMLSNGEYVLRQAAVRKYGVNYLDALNRGRPTPPRPGKPKPGESLAGQVLYDQGLGVQSGTIKPKVPNYLGSTKALINALASLESAGIQAAVSKLQDAVKKAFARVAKRTTLDDNLLKTIAAGNKQLTKLAADRERIADKLREAMEYAAGVTSGAKAFASLTSVAAQLGVDEEGNAIKPTVSGLAAGLRERLAVLRDYAGDIQALIGSGLSQTVLDQLLQAGPDQSAALADAIAAGGPAAVAEINNIQAQIDTVSKQLGEAGADYLYDAGAKAGAGFLTGLQGQLDALEAAAQALAERLVAAVEAGIAKAAALTQNVKVTETLAVQSGPVKPKPKPVNGSLASASGSSTGKLPAGFSIQHYHEAPRGSARQTAEELLFLSKARG